jgi:hypothetical protein
MYDRLTNSLWNQLTGEPVIGPLWDSGIKLDFFPVILTTWEEWLELHPDTTVLQQDTGLYPAEFYYPEEDQRAIYYAYFNDPETMFPVPDRDDQLDTKAVVLGVQLNDGYKAYSSEALREHRIVHDVVGGEQIVVLGSAASQGARAYYSGGNTFALVPDENGSHLANPQLVADADGVTWQVTEEFLVNTADESRSWRGYLRTCRSGSGGSNSTRGRSCIRGRDGVMTSRSASFGHRSRDDAPFPLEVTSSLGSVEANPAPGPSSGTTQDDMAA